MKRLVVAMLAIVGLTNPVDGQAVLRCIGQGPVRSVLAAMTSRAHPDTLVLRAIRLDSATLIPDAQARIDNGPWVVADSLQTIRVPLRSTGRVQTVSVRALGYWAARLTIATSPDSGLVALAVLEPGMICLQTHDRKL